MENNIKGKLRLVDSVNNASPDFRFVSCKLDEFSFTSKTNLRVLTSRTFPDEWSFSVSQGGYQYLEQEKTFVTGLRIKGQFTDEKEEVMMEFNAHMSGAFKTEKEFAPKTVRELTDLQVLTFP